MRDFDPEKNLSNSTEITGAKVKMPISEGCLISRPFVIFITFNKPLFLEEQIEMFADKLCQTYFGFPSSQLISLPAYSLPHLEHNNSEIGFSLYKLSKNSHCWSVQLQPLSQNLPFFPEQLSTFDSRSVLQENLSVESCFCLRTGLFPNWSPIYFLLDQDRPDFRNSK